MDKFSSHDGEHAAPQRTEADNHDDDTGADALVRRLLSVVCRLETQELRTTFLRTQLYEAGISAAAHGLNQLCLQADSGNERAREVMLSFVGVQQDASTDDWLQHVRAYALEHGLHAIAKRIYPNAGGIDAAAIIRAASDRVTGGDGANNAKQIPSELDSLQRVPDYGAGRSLTLGERKAIARRPNRRLFDRLLADPHPSVIHNLLNNSVTTEDDIVRLGARRPLHPNIIAEIARHPKWRVRRRVMMTLVLNPHCSPKVGTAIVALLTSSELAVVASFHGADPVIRRAAQTQLALKRDLALSTPSTTKSRGNTR